MSPQTALFHHPNTSGETLRYTPNTTTPSHPIPVTTEQPLTLLIRRLEAATSRLEDIANSAGAASPSGSVDHNFEHPNGLSMDGKGAGGMQEAASRSEPELTGMGREASTATVQQVKKEEVPESIEAMDELINEHVNALVDASKGLDPLVEQQVPLPTNLWVV